VREVDEKLQSLLEALQTACSTLGSQHAEAAWMYPGDWDGDLNDLEGIKDAFSHAQADARLRAALTEKGSQVADCMGRTTELAYLGMMERAFRMRHLSPSRAMAQSTVISASHGMHEGVHVGVVLQHVQNLLATGGSDAT
jgi:hypothetical protein